MKNKDIREIDSGTRADMLKKERELVTQNPGPLNKEPWAKDTRSNRSRMRTIGNHYRPEIDEYSINRITITSGIERRRDEENDSGKEAFSKTVKINPMQ
ncbi:hypothetical protein [Xenorhabdus indica]|uniref:hypothetical protein n=1 Tax=Xenorhabdus indica TaxID=333964 RepID=UPI0021D5075C|nr:hypothetical protein [Xenorhabdus indica]